VRFCHQCGSRLTLGTEKYCPECGTDLISSTAIDSGGGSGSTETHGYSTTTTDITGTSGDVIGSTVSGMGNIIGKEVAYSVHGNVINLHVQSVSAETLQQLENIVSKPIQLETKSFRGEQMREINTELIDAKINEAKVTKEETNQVLKDIDQISKEKGIHIEQIRVGAVQISRTELTLRDAILEGNEHFYKGEYSKAIESYDKALEINKKDVNAWNNKGSALGNLGRYDEAIECYDKVLEIDGKNVDAWNNKGVTLDKLGKHKYAKKCLDMAKQLA
jgi:tetratricopeptide (TPR) repeat protein